MKKQILCITPIKHLVGVYEELSNYGRIIYSVDKNEDDLAKILSDSQAEYSVDSKKLANLMETAHNFENVDAGLAKMDGYLN